MVLEENNHKTRWGLVMKQLVIRPINRDGLKGVARQIREQRELSRRRLELEVERQISDWIKERASIKEIRQNPDMVLQFMPEIAQYVEVTDFRVILFQIQGGSPLYRTTVRRSLEELFSEGPSQILYSRQNDEYVVINCKSVDDKRIMDRVEEWIWRQSSQFSATFTVGISGRHRGSEKLYSASSEAIYAINTRLLRGWNKVYLYDASPGCVGLLDNSRETALLSYLQSKDSRSAETLIRATLSGLYQNDLSNVHDLHDTVAGILKVLSNHYRTLSKRGGVKDESMPLFFFWWHDLYTFKKAAELEGYLLMLVRRLCRLTEDIADSGHGSIVEEIIDYLNHNYQYDLSLQELAERKYFMNLSYLSRLFKSKIGKTFSCYLRELRIAKAKELLVNSILKITEIAALVGYNDVSYFVQSFKRAYGLTPEEYRTRYMNEMKT
jgi:two-component system, response regulator YesN